MFVINGRVCEVVRVDIRSSLKERETAKPGRVVDGGQRARNVRAASMSRQGRWGQETEAYVSCAPGWQAGTASLEGLQRRTSSSHVHDVCGARCGRAPLQDRFSPNQVIPAADQ